MSKQLVVDIGNTRIKTAVFEDENLLEERSFQDLEQFKFAKSA
jgi:type III pantothenate kinase